MEVDGVGTITWEHPEALAHNCTLDLPLPDDPDALRKRLTKALRSCKRETKKGAQSARRWLARSTVPKQVEAQEQVSAPSKRSACRSPLTHLDNEDRPDSLCYLGEAVQEQGKGARCSTG